MTNINEEESCVTDHAVKKDPYYVAASNGPHQIITRVQLKNKNSSHSYDEWAKVIRTA